MPKAAIALSDHFTYKKLLRFTLPLLLGVDGVWFANDAAELTAPAVTVLFLVTQRKKYGY